MKDFEVKNQCRPGLQKQRWLLCEAIVGKPKAYRAVAGISCFKVSGCPLVVGTVGGVAKGSSQPAQEAHRIPDQVGRIKMPGSSSPVKKVVAVFGPYFDPYSVCQGYRRE